MSLHATYLRVLWKDLKAEILQQIIQNILFQWSSNAEIKNVFKRCSLGNIFSLKAWQRLDHTDKVCLFVVFIWRTGSNSLEGYEWNPLCPSAKHMTLSSPGKWLIGWTSHHGISCLSMTYSKACLYQMICIFTVYIYTVKMILWS